MSATGSSSSNSSAGASSGVTVTEDTAKGRTILQFPTSSKSSNWTPAHINILNVDEFLSSNSAASVRNDPRVQSAISSVMSGRSLISELPSDLSSKLESTHKKLTQELSSILKSEGDEGVGKWMRARMASLESTRKSWLDGTLSTTEYGTASGDTSDGGTAAWTNDSSTASKSAGTTPSSSAPGATESSTSPSLKSVSISRFNFDMLTRSYSRHNKVCSAVTTEYMHKHLPPAAMFDQWNSILSGTPWDTQVPEDLASALTERARETEAASEEAKNKGKGAHELWEKFFTGLVTSQGRAAYQTYKDGDGELGRSTASMPRGAPRPVSEADRLASTMTADRVKQVEAYLKYPDITTLPESELDSVVAALRSGTGYGKQGLSPEMLDMITDKRETRWDNMQTSPDYDSYVAEGWLGDKRLAGAWLDSTPTVSAAA